MGEVIWRQLTPAALDKAFTSFGNALAERIVLDEGDGDIMQQPQQPQADCGIIYGIGANLLKSGVEQLIVVDPGQHDPQDIGRTKQQGRRRGAAEPADQDPAELINTTDGSA